jgi:hypothetical protein
MNKSPLGLTPRHFWLRDRVLSCIHAIHRSIDIEDWKTFKTQVKSLAEELTYAVNEWDKYYED